MTRSIPFDEAVRLLREPGHVLVETFTPETKCGKAFSLTGKGGGRVTAVTAARILRLKKCRPADAGLFDVPQSYRMWG
jgi:hypothetical protein